MMNKGPLSLSGTWAIDCSPALAASLLCRLDIANKLAGSPWRLARDERGAVTIELRRGPLELTLIK